MSYLLFFFILLATFLTYMFFPRSDRFQIEVNREDPNIITFLNQHQAAKDYFYQMASWKDSGSSKGPFVFQYNDLVGMMPKTMKGVGGAGEINDICENNNPKLNGESDCFISGIFCLDNAGKLADCPQDKQYVVTYGYAPEW